MCDIIFAPGKSFEFRSPFDICAMIPELGEMIQTFGRNRNSVIIVLLISYLFRLSRA